MKDCFTLKHGYPICNLSGKLVGELEEGLLFKIQSEYWENAIWSALSVKNKIQHRFLPGFTPKWRGISPFDTTLDASLEYDESKKIWLAAVGYFFLHGVIINEQVPKKPTATIENGS